MPKFKVNDMVLIQMPESADPKDRACNGLIGTIVQVQTHLTPLRYRLDRPHPALEGELNPVESVLRLIKGGDIKDTDTCSSNPASSSLLVSSS